MDPLVCYRVPRELGSWSDPVFDEEKESLHRIAAALGALKKLLENERPYIGDQFEEFLLDAEEAASNLAYRCSGLLKENE